MTERTTPITVHLTDEQMDYIEQGWGPSVWVSQAANVAVYDAIKAQRPRPIAVGDRVKLKVHGDRVIGLSVEAVHAGEAWLWYRGGTMYWGTEPVQNLTRVDDKAATPPPTTQTQTVNLHGRMTGPGWGHETNNERKPSYGNQHLPGRR